MEAHDRHQMGLIDKICFVFMFLFIIGVIVIYVWIFGIMW